MPDGGLRRNGSTRHTHGDQRRINWLMAGVCFAAFLIFICIFVPLMVLRETDAHRQQTVQREEYNVADNWTNTFRTRLMDASYAGSMMEGLVLAGQPPIPPLNGTEEERVAGQFVIQFREIAEYLFAMLPTIAHMYLSPGGVINQCYPQDCPNTMRDLMSLDDPANRYTPTGPEVAESGTTGYVGPVRNNVTTAYNMEWVIQVRRPIYVARTREEVSLRTFWGFTSSTVNVTAIVQGQDMRRSMDEADMDFLLFRIGTKSGFIHTIACHFPGCDSDGSGGDEQNNNEIIPSQEALKAFMVTGSGQVGVLQGSTFFITVRYRKAIARSTPSNVATIIVCGVAGGLLGVLVTVLIVICCTREEDGRQSPAPKRPPFAVVTIGPSRADVLWQEAPECMRGVADAFLTRVKTAARTNGAYPVPRVHPYTHSYATRTVTDAIALAFEMIAWVERDEVDAELVKKLGAKRGHLLIACAVHWCEDATVRLSSLADPYPFRYEGPDVERAGQTWVVAAPNTVTLTTAALNHLEQDEPPACRRKLTVTPYVAAPVPEPSLTHAHDRRGSMNSSSATDGPLSLPTSSARRRQRSSSSDSATTDDAVEGTARHPKSAAGEGEMLFLATDPSQPLLCRALESARYYCDAPPHQDCASTHADRFECWNNVRPVSGSSSEAGGAGTPELSTRGVESDLPSALLLADSGANLSPGPDLSRTSLSVLRPGSTSVSESGSRYGFLGGPGRLTLNSGGAGGASSGSTSTSPSSSTSATPVARTGARPGRVGVRNPGVVINVSQGVKTAQEGWNDPLGHGFASNTDHREVDGTPLTGPDGGVDGFGAALPPPVIVLSRATAAEDMEEVMSSTTAQRVIAATDGTASNSGSSGRIAPAGVSGSVGHASSDGADGVQRITAFEAWYSAGRGKHRDRADSDNLHAWAERGTRESNALSTRSATHHSSSSHGGRALDDGDALTQLLLHPPIPKYLDDSLRSAFQYQVVGLALPYDAVQVLTYYLYNGYKLLFRPLAAAERSNIFRRFVVAFGVPSTNTLDHLAAWAAIRYVEQHEETRRLFATITHRHNHSSNTTAATPSLSAAPERPTAWNRADSVGTSASLGVVRTGTSIRSDT